MGTKAAAQINGLLGGRPKGRKNQKTILIDIDKLTTKEQREMEHNELVRLFGERYHEVFSTLIENSIKGDMVAMKELFNRVWGTAPQAINITGSVDNYFTFAQEFIDVVHRQKRDDELIQSHANDQLEENTEATRSVGVFDE